MPDLLEAIMRPTDPVKEELRQKLFKIDQFESKITKIRVCTFQMSGKIPDPTNVAFENPFSQYLAPLGAKYMEKRPKNIKNAGFSPKGWLPQKLKVPKWVCRSTRASFCNEPSLFRDIWPR